jgi:hypothetical protein
MTQTTRAGRAAWLLQADDPDQAARYEDLRRHIQDSVVEWAKSHDLGYGVAASSEGGQDIVTVTLGVFGRAGCWSVHVNLAPILNLD